MGGFDLEEGCITLRESQTAAADWSPLRATYSIWRASFLRSYRAARALFGGGMHFGSDREFNLPLGYKGGERFLYFRQTGEKYVR